MEDKFIYEKKIIGHLIKYYFKFSKLSISEFTLGNDEYLENTCANCNKCTNPERICSKNTLYRLFNGSIVSNECIYYRLASKLNKKVIFEQYDIYYKISKYQKILYDGLLNLSKTTLEKLEANIILEIERYKDTLYIYEILSLYLNVIKDKLYPGYAPKKEDIQSYLFVKNYVNEIDKKIILYYLYTGVFKRGDYNINLELIYQESKEYFRDDLMYEIKLDSIYELDLFNAYLHLVNNEMPKLNTLSTYHKYKLLKTLSNMQVNLGIYKDAYESILKCYSIIKKSDFGVMIYYACYLRLGFVSYCLKEYKTAIDWLLKAFEIRNNLSKDLVILCKSFEKCNDLNSLRLILEKTDISNAKALYGKKVYSYYVLKYKKKNLTKKDIINLENYICDVLKPYFKTYGSIHKDAFNEDLKEYVKTTGNYKKYYDFNY